MDWGEHPVWGDEDLRSAALDLLYAFLFMERPRAKGKFVAFETTMNAALDFAVENWGRDRFIANDDPGMDEPDPPGLDEIYEPGDDADKLERDIKKRYAGSVRRYLYGNSASISKIGLEGIDGLLAYALSETKKGAGKYQRIADRHDLWELKGVLTSGAYPEGLKEAADRALTKNHRRKAVVDLLAGWFGVTDQKRAAAAKNVTGVDQRLEHVATDEERGYYYCYRYSDRVGMIVKSFQVFTPADSEYPYTRFGNFLDRGIRTDRKADGVVVQIGRYTYCLGRIGDPGRAIKFIALQEPDKDGCLGGLILSMNRSVDRVLAARILMKKAPEGIVKHSDADTGVKNIENFTEGPNPELTSADLDRIKNEVAYNLGGKVIGGEDMADDIYSWDQLVAHHLKNCGTHYFRTAFGEQEKTPFDPVDRKLIPFNGVLGEFGPD